jgi:hypothetical protein
MDLVVIRNMVIVAFRGTGRKLFGIILGEVNTKRTRITRGRVGSSESVVLMVATSFVGPGSQIILGSVS